MTKRGKCAESKNTITRSTVSPLNIQTITHIYSSCCWKLLYPSMYWLSEKLNLSGRADISPFKQIASWNVLKYLKLKVVFSSLFVTWKNLQYGSVWVGVCRTVYQVSIKKNIHLLKQRSNGIFNQMHFCFSSKIWTIVVHHLKFNVQENFVSSLGNDLSRFLSEIQLVQIFQFSDGIDLFGFPI